MKTNVGWSTIARIARCLLLCGIGVLMVFIFITPTKFRYSTRDTSYVENCLQADLGLSLGNSELIAGVFRREPILVYQLRDATINEKRFSRVYSEQQKTDFVRRIAKIVEKEGVRLTLANDIEAFQFIGSDYTVWYMRSMDISYLVYLGAQ